MRPKEIVLCNAVIGILVGLFLSSVTKVFNPMFFWWSSLIVLIMVPMVSVFLVRHVAGIMGLRIPGLRFLIPVACLTEIIPVLGPIFGGSGSLSEIPIVGLLGAAGGTMWSLPIVIYAFIRRRPVQ